MQLYARRKYSPGGGLGEGRWGGGTVEATKPLAGLAYTTFAAQNRHRFSGKEIE